MIRLDIDDTLALITLDAPDRRNALNLQDWKDLGQALQDVNANDGVRCVVITGAGDHFAAGADISEFPENRASAAQAVDYGRVVQNTLEGFAALKHPSIAMIRGACAGGGLEVACCCDIRIADKEARFGIPINRLGHAFAYPEMAAALTVIPPAVLMDLLLDPRIIDADEAYALGLISRLVEEDELEDETEATVRRITKGAPLANRLNKQLIRRLVAGEAFTQADIDATYGLCDTDDYAEGVKAFIEKRKPEFKGS